MSSPDPRHSLLDDAQGLLTGSTMAAFGLVILTHLGLITGQMAGLAVLLSYVLGLPFGAVFFAINLPFYWIGYKRMGGRFIVKTFLSVSLLSLLSALIPQWISFDHLTPAFGAVAYGMISGMALLALFRHGASLGGIGILAVYLQDKTGFKAGHVQLLFDAVLFTIALFVLPLPTVLYSFLGAAILNIAILFNHRRDRYVGF